MIKELSFGAVIYKKYNNKLLYLLEFMGLGHVSLAKGHIEENETIPECVNREIKEELGMDVTVDYSHSRTITYSPKEGVIKDVTFYLATPKNDIIIVDNKEVLKASYYELDEAINLLTYESDKETIKWANKILEDL